MLTRRNFLKGTAVGFPMLVFPGLFTHPFPLSGLQLWLKADAITGVSDGADLTTWTDVSGQGHNFSSSGNNNPKYRSSTLLINGLPVVEHGVSGSGANQALKISNANFPTDSWSAATVVIVGRRNIDTEADFHDCGHAINFSRPADGSVSYFPFTSGSILDESFTTVNKTVGNPTPSLANAYMYLVTSAANAWEARLNGTSIHSTGTNTYKGNTADSNIGWSQIPPASSIIKYRGVTGEIMCWNRALDAKEISQVETYLDAKWAI
jgi:hypothetical protein